MPASRIAAAVSAKRPASPPKRRVFRAVSASPAAEPVKALADIPAPIADFGGDRVDHELAGTLVVEREGGELVRDRSLQRRGDGVDEPGQIEVGNHGVRDFEQQPEMVPLGRELPLRGLRLVEVQRVVGRYRHELRDLAQEGDCP